MVATKLQTVAEGTRDKASPLKGETKKVTDFNTSLKKAEKTTNMKTTTTSRYAADYAAYDSGSSRRLSDLHMDDDVNLK